jgi:ParB family transcriptional regulator, chromosome partitioning protein
VAVSNLIRLLDLPDDVIELLIAGALSEGHGRALLLAEDHDARRELARAALPDGWSVRITEERARRRNAGGGAGERRAKRDAGGGDAPHPDQEQASTEIAEALSAALGAEVRVKPARAGGYRAELSFSTAEEAIELARRLRPRVVV